MEKEIDKLQLKEEYMTDKEIFADDSFFLPEHILFREEENGAFLFNVNYNLLKAVNETGKDIIKFIQEKKSFSRIVESMSIEYEDVADVRLEEDVKRFIYQLMEQNYLVKQTIDE